MWRQDAAEIRSTRSSICQLTFANGDPFFSQDIRVTRLIKIHEKVNLSLIAEAFNIFNIANLTGYGSGLNRWQAPPGQLSAASNLRTAQ